MDEYHKKGGFRKGGAIIMAAVFLLGSSFSSLAAGNELTNAYEGYVTETQVKASLESSDAADQAAKEEIARRFNIDPEDIVIMDDVNMNGRGRIITLEWNVRAGKTYMSSGFSEDVGDVITATVVGDPIDMTFETGIKDPDNIMHCAEGSDTIYFEYEVEQDGRYYFFIINSSETEDLHIGAVVTK